jgi:hypothetical protein
MDENVLIIADRASAGLEDLARKESERMEEGLVSVPETS